MLRMRKGKEKKELIEQSGSGRSKSENVQAKSDHLLGWGHWLVLIAFVAAIARIAIYCNYRLPDALEPTADNDRFSETRALPILHRVSSLGPRPSGSKTLEEDVTRIIVDELNTIKAAAASTEHRLEVVTHRPSGCFDIPPHDVDGMTICYKNVSNIIARLGAKNRNWQESQTSVLVNCHYDSQPMSPGATDDIISCAVMLEMMRVLTDKRRPPVPVDVIFLFNGAEETGLQGAHGFITTHPWRHGVRAFFNLEGAGAGGRELLFQAGPGNQWLLNSYLEAAERPYCTVFGQEVFQSGFVPSDTDFRILRDYGNIPGLDIAYIHNGYVYHTEFDQYRLIPPGSMQRAGDNILATLLHLLHSPYLKTSGVTDERKFVFFDVLGFFTIVYSMEIGQAINYIVIALILAKVIYNTQKQSAHYPYTLTQLLSAFIVHVVATIAALATTFMLTKITVLLKLVLIWYSTPILTIFMYGVPAFAVTTAIHSFMAAKLPLTVKSRAYAARSFAREAAEQASFDAQLIIFGIFLCALTFMKIASAYLLLIFILFPLARDVILSVVGKVAGSQVHLLAMIPGVTMLSYSVVMVVDIFVPIYGRSKLAANPETTIGAALAVSACILALMTSSLLYRTRKMNILLIATFASIVLLYGSLATGLFIAPYHYDSAAPTLRRAQIVHMRRRVYDTLGHETVNENGIVIIPYDYRGADDFPQVAGDSSFRKFHCTTINKYCELPYLLPHAEVLPYAGLRFKPIDEQLSVANPTSLTLVSKNHLTANEIQYSFVITGGDHMSLQLTAQSPYHIVKWNFLKETETPEYEISAFVFLSNVGEKDGRWEFTITIKKQDNTPLSNNGSELLVTAVSHYLHGKDARSRTLQDFVSLVETNREGGAENWRWAMTLFAWSGDILSRFF